MADEPKRIDVRKRKRDPQPPPCKPGECDTNGFIVGNVFNIYYCAKCGGNQDWL